MQLSVNYLRKQGVSISDAEDAVQEAVLSIWKAGNYDSSITSFSTYIIKIASRKWIDIARKRRSKILDLEDVVVVDKTINAPSFDERYEEAAVLKSKIKMLPLIQQEMIQLIYYRNMNFRVVAEYLDMPLGTVKSSISRALNNLRNSLDAA